jgi:threonine/homoserine/homoserine lactone efflux protein
VSGVWEYSLLALGLTLLPGADNALTLRTSLMISKKAGFIVSAGIISGLFIWGPLAGFGAAALLTEGSIWFQILKIAGVLYLSYLAIDIFRSSKRNDIEEIEIPKNLFWKGFANNLFNPKAGIFYVTVMPQFLPPDMNAVLGGLLLAGIHAVWGVLWLAALVLAAAQLRPMLSNPVLLRRIDITIAVGLAFFALRLATS